MLSERLGERLGEINSIYFQFLSTDGSLLFIGYFFLFINFIF